MKSIEIYIDGVSKGNPGPAGIGVVMCEGGEVIKNLSQYIGNTTNNLAEYTALIYALQEALIMRAENLIINSDSQLLCRQIKKEYKVKNPNISAIFNQALRLISAFKDVRINHIPRENNRGADKLANKAVKSILKRK